MAYSNYSDYSLALPLFYIRFSSNCRSYFDDEISSNDSITALAAQGQVIWIGTHAARLLLVDVSSPWEQQMPPLHVLGIQYDQNKGKVKGIIPFTGLNKP